MVPLVAHTRLTTARRHRAPLVLQEVYVEMGSGRAGGPWTPSRCVETQGATWAKRAEGAVPCQRACGRCRQGQTAVPLSRRVFGAHGANVQIPSPSGLTSPRRSTTPFLSASRQLRTTARPYVVWPDDRQLEAAGTGPSDWARYTPRVGQSAVEALLLGDTAQSLVRGAGSFGLRERGAPHPARPGTGEPRTGAKWCSLRSQ